MVFSYIHFFCQFDEFKGCLKIHYAFFQRLPDSSGSIPSTSLPIRVYPLLLFLDRRGFPSHKQFLEETGTGVVDFVRIGNTLEIPVSPAGYLFNSLGTYDVLDVPVVHLFP